MGQERTQSVRRRFSWVAAVAGLLTSIACGARTTVTWEQPVVARVPSQEERLYVMAPQWTAGPNPGNVGRDVAGITSDIGDRILATVRQRIARAEQVPANVRIAVPLPAGYEAALPGRITPEERRAASWTVEHGVPLLIVPTVVEWKEMRTDDPIGALSLPHNSIAITVRLMQMEPPTVVAEATFRSRARLTLNQGARQLLDERFQTMVLELVSTAAPLRHP